MRGIVLLAAAVALGIGLLQAFDTGGSSDFFDADVSVGDTTTSIDFETDTTDGDSPGTSTTVRVVRPPSQVKVLVANGTGVKGLGAKLASELQKLGYNTLAATDSTRSLEATSIQYADDYQAEAEAVAKAADLPTTAVQPLNNPPVDDVKGAHVVVLLGIDTVPSSTTPTTRRGGTTTTTRRTTTTSG